MAKALERPLLLPKDMDALKHMRQLDLFLFLKRDLALVSSLACFIKSVFLSFFSLLFYIYIYFTYSSVVYVQVIQEVFMVEEWVKDARNEVEANLYAETNKALGITE